MKKTILFLIFILLIANTCLATELETFQAIGTGTLSFFKNYSGAANLDADYSVGSATATYAATRTGSNISQGTYFDGSGNLVVFTGGDNAPRFTSGWYDERGWHTQDDYGNNISGYLNEGSVTNQALYTETFENDAWVKTNITADDDDAGSNNLYGNAGVTSLTATDANGTAIQQPTLSSSTYTFSVWLKRKTGSGPVYISVDNGTSLTWCEVTTEWRRFHTAIYAAQTTPTAYIKIATSGDAVYAFGAQLEAGKTMTSYIPVAAETAQTRNRDELSYAISGNRTTGDETIAVQYYSLSAFNDGGNTSLITNWPGTRQITKSNAGETWRFSPNSSDSAEVFVIASNGGHRGISQNIIAVARTATNPDPTAEIYVNGVLEAEDTTNGQWATGTYGTAWRVAQAWNNASQFPCILNKIAIYQMDLSSEDITTLSGLMNNSYATNLTFEKTLINTDSPVTMGSFASRIPNQNSSFYAAGRYWVFYLDNNAATDLNFKYMSSVDGLSLVTGDTGANIYDSTDADWSINFDGTYVHYIRGTKTDGTQTGLAYRRGSPNSDGTITWSADEQVIHDDSVSAADKEIGISSDGRPWIAYFQPGDSNDALIVTTSETDGTFSMDDGYPYTIEVNDGNKRPCAVPLQLLNGDMYFLVYYFDVSGTDQKLNGYFYDSSEGTFTQETNITDVAVEGSETGSVNTFVDRATAVSKDGIVYVAYQGSDRTLRFKQRSAEGAWGDEEIFAGMVKFPGLAYSTDIIDNDTTPQIIVGGSGDLYFMWDVLEYGVYFKKRNADGTWDATKLLIPRMEYVNFTHIQPWDDVENGQILFKYFTNTYDVNFDAYQVEDVEESATPTKTWSISNAVISNMMVF